MKVNELMIGDWFFFDNTLHRVCALKGDLKCNLIGYTDNGRLRKWITDSVVEPIRLTHNILLANGWRKVVYGEYTLYLIGDVGDPEFTVEYVSEYDYFLRCEYKSSIRT